MGDKFEIVTAFSREGKDKVYVQHRLKEYAAEVNKLLEQKANFVSNNSAMVYSPRLTLFSTSAVTLPAWLARSISFLVKSLLVSEVCQRPRAKRLSRA